MSPQPAFLAPAALPGSSSIGATPAGIRRQVPRCCAAVPSPTRGGRSLSKRVAAVRGPVVDTRVQFATEAHHWISVSPESVRMFERAAVAQADMVRRVERQVGSGALHRWVLRAVSDPLEDDDAAAARPAPRQATYVVMETYKLADTGFEAGAMHRWLGAVERAGRALDSVVTTTLRYANVFTAKRHEVSFDVDETVVVLESLTADGAQKIDALRSVLEAEAQAAVSTGDCQEFCVLQSADKPGFFKTLEVYKDTASLRKHMEGLDISFMQKAEPLVAHSMHRSRSAFKPVVFW